MVKDSIYLIFVVFLCYLFHLLQSRRAVTWSLQRFIFHPRLSWQRFVVSWTSWPSFYRKSTQPWKKFGAQSQPEWWQWLITARWGAHGYQGGTLGQRNHAYPQCTPKNTPRSLGSFWGQNKRGDYWFEIFLNYCEKKFYIPLPHFTLTWQVITLFYKRQGFMK
jgi:hypothetical protein